MQYSSATLDPYATLGVPRDASPQAIKQAYRRIALETHPDRNGNDPSAAERFRRATQAYELLRDPKRRLAFDRTGRWEDSSWDVVDLDVQLAEALDIFARDFGAAFDIPLTEDRAPAHAARTTVMVDVSYEDVEGGARRSIPAPCRSCSGTGAREGSTQVRCTTCGGSGRIRHVETSFLGPRIHTESCETCHGSGRRPLVACHACQGSGRSPGNETVEVLIPPGTADGDALPSPSTDGIRFVARLIEDQRWAREGADLYAIARIPYEMAVLGGPVTIELPGRKYTIDVAAGTASGHRMRISGQGLPLRDGSGRGDLVVTLHVAVPTKLGLFERLVLRTWRARATGAEQRGIAGRIAALQARARNRAVSRWREWCELYEQSSLVRIEKAAASLRSAAGMVSQSEQRLGSLLERAFPLIVPEAASARRRLGRSYSDLRNAAITSCAIDGLLVFALTFCIGLGAIYARPFVATAGMGRWWSLLTNSHPVIFALVPLLAGLAMGAIRESAAPKWIRRLALFPLGALVGLSAAGTGASMYAIGSGLSGGTNLMLRTALSLLLAVAVGIMPGILFLLAMSLVRSARVLIEESIDRADQRALRRYDTTAVRLATSLEATEKAFRQLLTEAHDARHPLTSLMNGAADSLAGERHRRNRSANARAVTAFAASLGISALWFAATLLAIMAAFNLFPDAPGWARIPLVAAIAPLCGLGALLPPTFLELQRTRRFLTILATIAAIVALVGILVVGAIGASTALIGWLAAVGAVGALALSFRLPEAIGAASLAAGLLVSGSIAVLLWPFAFAYAAIRGR